MPSQFTDFSEPLAAAMRNLQTGEVSQATRQIASLLQHWPDCAAAWHLAGVIACQTGRLSGALQYIGRAIELEPVNCEYYCNLSSVLRKLQRPREALDATGLALQLAPESHLVHHNHAASLYANNQLQAAAVAYREALRLGSDSLATLNNLALTLQQIGETGEAIEYYQQSLDRDWAQVMVWNHLAELVRHGHYSLSPQQEQMIRKTLGTPGLSAHDAAMLVEALAIQRESEGECQAAFVHFRQANDRIAESRRSQADPYQLETLGQSVEEQMRLYSQRCMRQSAGLGSSSRRPLFVIGMPRSGTTLIESILARHPDLSGAGELPAMNRIAHAAFDVLRQGNRLSHKMIGEWADEYLQQLNRLDASSLHVVDKTPENYLHLGLITQLFPRATIVHIQRDPRDVALSCYCRIFQSLVLRARSCTLAGIICWYREYRRLMDHWLRVLPGRVVQVTYERLVRDPELEIRKLVAACELSFGPHLLETGKGYASRTASALQVQKPISEASVGKWRRFGKQVEVLTEEWGDEQLPCLRDLGATTEHRI